MIKLLSKDYTLCFLDTFPLPESDWEAHYHNFILENYKSNPDIIENLTKAVNTVYAQWFNLANQTAIRGWELDDDGNPIHQKLNDIGIPAQALAQHVGYRGPFLTGQFTKGYFDSHKEILEHFDLVLKAWKSLKDYEAVLPKDIKAQISDLQVPSLLDAKAIEERFAIVQRIAKSMESAETGRKLIGIDVWNLPDILDENKRKRAEEERERFEKNRSNVTDYIKEAQELVDNKQTTELDLKRKRSALKNFIFQLGKTNSYLEPEHRQYTVLPELEEKQRSFFEGAIKELTRLEKEMKYAAKYRKLAAVTNHDSTSSNKHLIEQKQPPKLEEPPKPSLGQVALICIYTNKKVTKTKRDAIAEEFGWKSGEALEKKYRKYDDYIKRTASGTKKQNRTKIKDIQKAIDFLKSMGVCTKRAEGELKDLKVNINEDLKNMD